ncbi:MAG TPA: hypothetical protein VLG09_04000 [Candidatus Saccharimonadales bacterium]|nr:hypothetical protein [Candidatus Saccharimonadales bacterium]
MAGVDPFSTGLSLIGSLTSFLGDKKKYKLSKQQLDLQKQLADHQISIDDYIQGLSKQLMDMGSTQVDPYGGVTGYDPVTKTYRSTLGPVQQALQDASDREEAKRLTVDQAMRRGAMSDAERNRQLAGGAERQALDELGRFKQGVGAVDEGQLASSIRLNREREVNAGYDDAERAAQTLALRTGSSAVGDALTALARDRVRAQASIGDPNLDALQTAQGINSQRAGDITNQYGVFANRASMMPDVSFTPAPYAGIADAKIGDLQKFDLGKYDVAQGGSGTAAAGIGQAAAGLRAAYDTSPLKTGNLLSSAGQTIGALGNNKDITNALMKLFNGG